MAVNPEVFLSTNYLRPEVNSSVSAAPAEIQTYLDSEIGAMANSIARGFFHTETHPTIPVFAISGGEDGIVRRNNKAAPYRTPRSKLQEIALSVMKKYGLELTYSIQRETSHPQDELAIEIRSFPSRKIKGLTFIRSYTYETGTGTPIMLSWEAVDESPVPKLRKL